MALEPLTILPLDVVSRAEADERPAKTCGASTERSGAERLDDVLLGFAAVREEKWSSLKQLDALANLPHR